MVENFYFDRGYKMIYNSPEYPKRYMGEHRLIMERLIGRKLKTDEHVHHKDGNRSNNKVSNLELLTRQEHMRIHNGVHHPHLGENNGAAKLTKEQVIEIREKHSYLSRKELAELYKVSYTAICGIVNRTYWKHVI